MNYLREITAFYDWLETNQLPTSAISLWHALMHIANRTGWQNKFAVAVSVLEIKTGLSRKTIYEARNKLKQASRITFAARPGNQSALYSMIPVCNYDTQQVTQRVMQQVTQPVTQLVTEQVTQQVTINKQNETKHKNNPTDCISVRFTPPSIQDVKQYCEERKNNVDPQRFVDFYTSKGWMVGKAKMKDWQAAVRTWEDRDGTDYANSQKDTPRTGGGATAGSRFNLDFTKPRGKWA